MTLRARTWVLPASMLLGTFAWSFVYVSLPFHIQKMSTLDAAATLRWTGWVLGISPLITVITAPISGRHRRAHRSQARLHRGAGVPGAGLPRHGARAHAARDAGGPRAPGLDGRGVHLRLHHGGALRRRRAPSGVLHPVGHDAGAGDGAGGGGGGRGAPRVPALLRPGRRDAAGPARPSWPGGCRPEAARPAGRGRRGGRRSASSRPRAWSCSPGPPRSSSSPRSSRRFSRRSGCPGTPRSRSSGFLLLITGLAAALGAMAAPRLAEVVGDRRALIWFLLGSSVLVAALGVAGTCGASGSSASCRCSASRRCSRSRWRRSRSGRPGKPSDS